MRVGDWGWQVLTVEGKESKDEERMNAWERRWVYFRERAIMTKNGGERWRPALFILFFFLSLFPFFSFSLFPASCHVHWLETTPPFHFQCLDWIESVPHKGACMPVRCEALLAGSESKRRFLLPNPDISLPLCAALASSPSFQAP